MNRERIYIQYKIQYNIYILQYKIVYKNNSNVQYYGLQ